MGNKLIFTLIASCALLVQGNPAMAKAQQKHHHKAVKVAQKARIHKEFHAHKPQRVHSKQEDDELTNLVMEKAGTSPRLYSNIALVYDAESHRPLYAKNADTVAPIASITKLMTAMVVLDANLPMDEPITISEADVDTLKGTHSRMRPGMTLTRAEMLKLALMSSENRAACALARTYPGGTAAAVAKMNEKARALGMTSTRFLEPSGLNSNNVSTAQDLVRMVDAADNYALIHEFTTTASHVVTPAGYRTMQYNNTNPLVKNASWDIGVSKTGFINEAGRCLVMEANIQGRPIIMVLLDSQGKQTRVGDAARVKKWMESSESRIRPTRNI
ncbi:D-alanyl-D-alanine endopeptidase [Ferriphaselus sp. R-1]|uniref:D-alanyl-D-alanine endopeptidase n=1 Tax=Ferriphaselus sp. R-1 TaxID=1485544 RepID=UPI000553FB77|nr:D-alanyl-D-alanine endopeptidase [Ferriphaselus sp. R-1]